MHHNGPGLHPQVANPWATAKAVRAAVPVPQVWLLVLATLLTLLVLPTLSLAQSDGGDIPPNAHARGYGSGWDCDKSYRVNGKKCIAIVVPENAYPTNRPYGAGWKCNHGFKQVDEASCLQVVVPRGGYLSASGENWECLRGNLKVGDSCQKVVLPDNAYMSDNEYGRVWLCDRGYSVKGNGCVAIKVPEHAYLNTSNYGQPWTCERGYYERGNRCEAVKVPENGYFHDAAYGVGWKCDRGYFASGNRCVAMELPENAHIDRSGNRWECHGGFRRSKGGCTRED